MPIITPSNAKLLTELSEKSTAALTDIIFLYETVNSLPYKLPLSKLGIIIESGSNSNGTWIKFSDGTMICSYYNNSFSCNITNAALGGYRSTGMSWNFPAQFLSGTIPVVIGSGDGNLGIVSAYGKTNTYGVFTFSAVTSQETADRVVHLLAIGRWKE